jgi:hypothetical protein
MEHRKMAQLTDNSTATLALLRLVIFRQKSRVHANVQNHGLAPAREKIKNLFRERSEAAVEADHSVLKTLDWHIHTYRTDPMYANGGLTDAVNLMLQYDHEVFPATPHQVGHVLTSFGLTERKRTNTGWVLLLRRDTRERIHTLLRRYAVELESSVNCEGCSMCSDAKIPSAGTCKSAKEPEQTALAGESKIGASELGELRALKTG